MDIITVFFNGSQRKISVCGTVQEFVVPKSTSLDSVVVLSDGEASSLVELDNYQTLQFHSTVTVKKCGEEFVGKLMDLDPDTVTIKQGEECGVLKKIRKYDTITTECGYVNDKVKQILVCRPCPAEKTQISFLFSDLKWYPTYNFLLNLETLQAMGSLNAEIINDTGIVFENNQFVLSTRNVYFPVTSGTSYRGLSVASAQSVAAPPVNSLIATSSNRVFNYPLQQGKVGRHSIIPLTSLNTVFSKFALINLGRSSEGSAILLYRFLAPKDLPSGDIKLFALCGDVVGEFLGTSSMGDKIEGEIVDIELAPWPDVKYNAVIVDKLLEETPQSRVIQRNFNIMIRSKSPTQIIFVYSVESAEVLNSPSNSVRRGSILEFVINVSAGASKVEFEFVLRELKM